MTMPQLRKSGVAPMPPDALVLDNGRLVLCPLTLDDIDLAVARFSNPDAVEYVCEVFCAEDMRDHLPGEVKRAAGGRIRECDAPMRATHAEALAVPERNGLE